jgi:hypothetical protein
MTPPPLPAHPVARFGFIEWRHNCVETGGIVLDQVAELSVFSTKVAARRKNR